MAQVFVCHAGQRLLLAVFVMPASEKGRSGSNLALRFILPHIVIHDSSL